MRLNYVDGCIISHSLERINECPGDTSGFRVCWCVPASGNTENRDPKQIAVSVTTWGSAVLEEGEENLMENRRFFSNQKIREDRYESVSASLIIITGLVSDILPIFFYCTRGLRLGST